MNADGYIFCLPPGEYWIGDLRAALHDDVYDACINRYLPAMVELEPEKFCVTCPLGISVLAHESSRYVSEDVGVTYEVAGTGVLGVLHTGLLSLLKAPEALRQGTLHIVRGQVTVHLVPSTGAVHVESECGCMSITTAVVCA